MTASIVAYADIVELIGEFAALDLSKVRGGRALYIPSPTRLGEQSPVVRLVGMDCALKLAERFGGTHIDIPIGPGKRARVWELKEQGWTAGRIAGEMRCTERTVWNILGGTRPRTLGPAPTAELPPLLAYLAER